MSRCVCQVMESLSRNEINTRDYNGSIGLPIVGIAMLEPLNLDEAIRVLQKAYHGARSTIQNRLSNKRFRGLNTDHMRYFACK